MHFVNRRNRFSQRPFKERGASLYAAVGSGPGVDPGPDAIQFRHLRVAGQPILAGPNYPGAKIGTWVAQTLEVTPEIALNVPAEWLNRIVWIQVRTCWSDCELDHNSDPLRLDFTTLGALDQVIVGTGRIIAADKRDGGTARIRASYFPTTNGIQPTAILIRKTSGPGTLADVTSVYDPEKRNYELTTAALVDEAVYTFALVAKNGAVELQLDTITFTADNAGPPAPTGVTLTPT